MDTMTKRRIIAVLLIAALALAGCGGIDQADATSVPTPNVAAAVDATVVVIIATIEAESNAYLATEVAQVIASDNEQIQAFETQIVGEGRATIAAWLAMTPSATPGPTATAEPTQVVKQTIRPGTWLVPQEVKPGTYQGQCGSGCYWERLSCLTGDFDCILSNRFVETGQFYVEIRASDFAIRTDTNLVEQ